MKLRAKLTALLVTAALLLSGCHPFIKTQIPLSSESTSTTEGTAASSESAASTASPTEKPAEPNGDISPLIWKVTGEKGNTLYLFGTIHMGDERNNEVMRLVSGKLDACDALAVEFDIEALEKDPERQTALTMKTIYTDGTTVKDHLRSDLYEQSVKYMTDNDNYEALYDYLILSEWTILLQQTAIAKSKFSLDHAMETKLLQYAGEHQKEILEVESAEFQYEMEAGFPDALCELQIESFLEGKDTYESDLSELYEYWLSGDEQALTELEYGTDEEEYAKLTEEEKQLYANYQKTMLTDRNVGMANKAEQYLKSGKNVFMAVGAAHMVSDEGVVQLLKDRGYTVTADHFS